MNCPKEALKEDFTASQGELPDQVNSDQIVLGIFRREAGPDDRRPCLVISEKLVPYILAPNYDYHRPSKPLY